jgi:hypothetical protein
MKVVIKPYGCLPCSAEVFTIKGKNACTDDFGREEDLDSYNAEPYSCSDMQFIPHNDPTEGVLKYYKITKKEYREIQEKLKDALDVGSCGWCV